MADYHRFVAYIYEYVKGKKHQNTGFAKVEVRNGICRVQIHIQNVTAMDGKLEIFVIVREKEKERIFLLGEGMTHGNIFDQRFMTPEEHLAGTPHCFEEVCGIYIRSQNGRKWMTVFDEEPIKIEKLKEEVFEEELEEVQAEEVLEEESEEVQAEEVLEEESEEVQAEEVLEEESEEVQAEKVLEEESEKMQEKELPEKEPEICRACKAGSDLRWKRATARYVHMQAVLDENIEDTIRIRPSDLNTLWQKGMRQGSNSFLMHGFYHYHHLILGKKRSGGYILGVPGFYQEKNMAQMFGFPEFRKAYHVQAAEITEETYGYWCKDLEE